MGSRTTPVIAPVNRLPAIIRLIPAARFAELRKAHPERETTEQSGAPYAMSARVLQVSERPSVRGAALGELVAVNVDTGLIAWRSVLGDIREPAEHQASGADGIAEPRRPDRDRHGPRLHRRDARSVPARLRRGRRPGALEGRTADERARDADDSHEPVRTPRSNCRRPRGATTPRSRASIRRSWRSRSTTIVPNGGTVRASGTHSRPRNTSSSRER